MRHRAALLSMPVLLALASCGDDTAEPAASAPPTTVATVSVDGRTFLSTETPGIDLVDGTVVRLSFEAGTVSISGGCNNIAGPYSLDRGVLTVTELSMTEMGCEQPLMDQDTRLIELLTAEPTLTLDGDQLTLTSPTGTITFTDREVADPDRPLEGTRWVVDTIIDGDAASTVPMGAEASLTITNGVAAIEAGCNTGTAEVTVADGTLTTGPMTLTEIACDEAVMALEGHVRSTLDGATVAYEIEADRLTLTNGTTGLGLLAVE